MSANQRSGVRQAIILLSDGFSDSASAIAAADSIKGKGGLITSIGLGTGADNGLLTQIASTSSDAIFAFAESDLAQAFEK